MAELLYWVALDCTAVPKKVATECEQIFVLVFQDNNNIMTCVYVRSKCVLFYLICLFFLSRLPGRQPPAGPALV